jgi:hypothetical protein
MSDPRKTVLLADAKDERASLLKKIIEEDFRTPVVLVKTFDAVKAEVYDVKKLNSRWRLVLMAQDLPFTLYPTGSIQPDNFSFISQMEAVVSLGCIYSSPEPPDLTGVSFDPIFIRVPPPPMTDAHRNIVIENIRQERRRIRLVLSPSPPIVELDKDRLLLAEDPILREQVRYLDKERELDKAKDLLAHLIRDFNLADCKSVIVSKLGQGASGATVFRFRPKGDDLKVNERVLKISAHDKEWKLVAEVEKHLLAKDTLGNQYKRHVPDIEEARSDADSEIRYIAAHEGWRAIAYDFLGGAKFREGGKEFGKFIDLETALIASPEELQERTRKTEFENYFADPTLAQDGRKYVLETLLDWLCKNWYLKYAERLEPEKLWDYSDGSDDQFSRFPPYQLPARSKRFILSFLDGGQARMGARFFDDWTERHQRVREFVTESESKLSTFYSLHREHAVILSPAHGDLNSNNILLWLDYAHPFLIDFPFFQKSGHALQDFARLEVEIKFLLMDRQEGCPPDKLRAYDHTHSQVPLWKALEDYLLKERGSKGPLNLPPDLFGENVRLSHDLVMLLRGRAKEVQEQKKETRKAPGFWTEYRPALLYHTLRTIGYDTLSPFKRLLAVYSSAELLKQCRVK